MAYGASAVGTYAVIVTANDGTYSNSESLNWTITNPITFTAIATQDNLEGDAVSLSLSASDSSSGTLEIHSRGFTAGHPHQLDHGGNYRNHRRWSRCLCTVQRHGRGRRWHLQCKPDAHLGHWHDDSDSDLHHSGKYRVDRGCNRWDTRRCSGTGQEHNLDRKPGGPAPVTARLTLNSDGSFTYTPTTNFYGTDTFTVNVSDGSTNSLTVTEAIQVQQNLSQTNNDFVAVATGDFNGDGNQDFVAANNATASISLFLGYGDGTFQTPTVNQRGQWPQRPGRGQLRQRATKTSLSPTARTAP